MGKIRVKTLGDEDLEKEQKKEARLGREARQAKKRKETKKLSASIVEAEENKKPAITETASNAADAQKKTEAQKLSDSVVAREASKKLHKTPKTHKTHKPHRSQKYQTVAKMLDKNKLYKLSEALEILPSIHMAKFDETVELHINTTEKGISGNLNLPHGTGKKVRVAIANDDLINQIEKGGIDFDILLAEPSMMPKLAKVARILGPRGLMPNPKNGTISQNPEEATKKFEGGQTNFKTEAKNPIIHLSVGKLSFGDKKLFENIKTALSTISSSKIKKVVLKSTMSPGIKIDYTSI